MKVIRYNQFKLKISRDNMSHNEFRQENLIVLKRSVFSKRGECGLFLLTLVTGKGGC